MTDASISRAWLSICYRKYLLQFGSEVTMYRFSLRHAPFPQAPGMGWLPGLYPMLLSLDGGCMQSCFRNRGHKSKLHDVPAFLGQVVGHQCAADRAGRVTGPYHP